MKTVLIIDDAAFMRLTLKTMLERNGFKVIGEANNGVQGILKYAEFQPDLVTMDITMPEMDGVTALKKITSKDPSAKVVMVSAMGQQSIVKEAIMSGAKYFLVKPFKEEEVIEALNKVFEM